MIPIDLKIVELDKRSFNGLQDSKLMLEFMGTSSNTILVNTLRRLAMDYIPTYAFPKDTINIENSTSIYDNDEMRLRLEQLVVPNIKIPIAYLDDKYWLDIKHNNIDRLKHPKDNQVIEMNLNMRNDTSNIIDATTNDVEFFINGDKKKVFDEKYPHLIVRLNPKEVFVYHAKASLGIGAVNNIWSAVANAYYEEISENKIKLSLHSQGQMDEYEILYKACIIMIDEMNHIKDLIKSKYTGQTKIKENKLKIKLENRDHTFGNMINYALQSHKNVSAAGLSKPDHLINEIHILFETFDNDPLKSLYESIDYVIKLFNEIKVKLKTLGGKFIDYKE